MKVDTIKVPVWCIRDGQLRTGYIQRVDDTAIYNECDFANGLLECSRCRDEINRQIFEGIDYLGITEQNPLRP